MNTDRLKFRVWDSKSKCYLNTADLYIDSNGDLCVQRLFCGRNEMFHDVDHGTNIVEQCTGLKDANGKLIYEGDIIGIPFKPVVKWDYSRSCFILDDGKPHLPLANRAILETSLIVGNIHENPELLEGNK